jgi:hypothetical protein
VHKPTCCDSAGFNCNQGRDCPVRQACELPERDTDGALTLVEVFVVILAASVAAAFLIRLITYDWPQLVAWMAP